MHGTTVAASSIPPGSLAWKRSVLDTDLAQGHALAVADLNNDGKPDLVASGRATKNVIIYWNQSK